MLDRSEYENLAAAAKKFYVQERKESKLQKALDTAMKIISELKAKVTALTAEHKALLWESFLADGQQPLEFAWLWEIYYTDQTRWLLEWELALDMVLDQLSFQVNRDTNSFCLLDGTGRERRFDFTRGGPAEKLFLKLLFPLDTR